MLNKTIAIGVLAILAAQSAAVEAKTLRLGHSATESNPRHEAALFFAKRIDALSDGDLQINVSSNAQLGDDHQMLSQIRLGSLALSISSQGALGTVIPEANMIGLPFLFSDVETAWRVMDGKVGERLSEKAQEDGIVMLGYWDNGLRQITNNVRPIEHPDDLQGLKIRVPPDEMGKDIIAALGATPTPIDFSETYLALQQGVVDGQENPIANIYSQKFYEVQDYLSMTNHKYEILPFMASATIWNTLSDEEKAWMRQAAKEALGYQRNLMQEQQADQIDTIRDSGVQVAKVDADEFRASTRSVYDKWEKQYPDFSSLIESAAEEARQ
ncbi:TRAP transporter substrate-binding protein [Salinicola peritrichatus]|uniref:TRAP transporter substrate-binding protein n=1 Tax=Salinicola peritrichatus TaxID=1267424 RepID=UPI000DA173AD|nr:TRAP transporter substrate-binding protein [Salinicola peritrichatus]